MIIAVDFDGTIVTHEYPFIGKPAPDAIEAMKSLIAMGHQLILFTMRSGAHLKEAVYYCKEHGVEFWGVNENPDQHTWSESRKVYAQKYIDDAAIGAPLIFDLSVAERPFIDWGKVMEYFKPEGSK